MNLDKYRQYLEKLYAEMDNAIKNGKAATTAKQKVHYIIQIDKLIVQIKRLVDRLNRIEELHCNSDMQEGLCKMEKETNEMEKANNNFWRKMERIIA